MEQRIMAVGRGRKPGCIASCMRAAGIVCMLRLLRAGRAACVQADQRACRQIRLPPCAFRCPPTMVRALHKSAFAAKLPQPPTRFPTQNALLASCVDGSGVGFYTGRMDINLSPDL